MRLKKIKPVREEVAAKFFRCETLAFQARQGRQVKRFEAVAELR